MTTARARILVPLPWVVASIAAFRGLQSGQPRPPSGAVRAKRVRPGRTRLHTLAQRWQPSLAIAACCSVDHPAFRQTCLAQTILVVLEIGGVLVWLLGGPPGHRGVRVESQHSFHCSPRLRQAAKLGIARRQEQQEYRRRARAPAQSTPRRPARPHPSRLPSHPHSPGDLTLSLTLTRTTPFPSRAGTNIIRIDQVVTLHHGRFAAQARKCLDETIESGTKCEMQF